MSSPRIENSSGSSFLPNSGSEENLHHVTDQRKRKRMVSNRESARRSRMRKQRHLDDLTGQIIRTRDENNRILAHTNIVTQLYLNVESENSILMAQIIELNHRLEALNEIINCKEIGFGFDHGIGYDEVFNEGGNRNHVDDFLNPNWSLIHVNQSLMASHDVLMY